MDEDNKISITVCGDGGCGKSSLTLRLVRSQWTQEYDPTIEDSYSVTRTIDGETYLLNLTDTAGQEEYRSVWQQKTSPDSLDTTSSSSPCNTDAFLLVYDITSAASLAALDHFATIITAECETRLDRGGVLPVRIVAGNKCDLQVQRQVSAQRGLEWARNRKCGFMETSAREMVNVEETFALLVRRVVEARRAHAAGNGPPHTAATTEPLTPLNEKEDDFADGGRNVSRRSSKGGDGGRQHKAGFWKSLRCW